MRQLLTQLPRPFIMCVVRDDEPLKAIATMNGAHFDGAQAYDLHIARLKQKYRTFNDFHLIINATASPVMVLHYRQYRCYEQPSITEEQRAEELLLGVKAGAAAVDMQGDLFDPDPPIDFSTFDYRNEAPRDFSVKPEIIKKQKQFMNQVRDLGGEVVMSSHTRVVMTAEEVLEHAQKMEQRNPDVIKIVTVCMNEDDLLEFFRATVLLRRKLKLPFQYQLHGTRGKLSRVVGPMLGSMFVFCNYRYDETTLNEQPLVSAMHKVFTSVDWKVSPLLDEEVFNYV